LTFSYFGQISPYVITNREQVCPQIVHSISSLLCYAIFVTENEGYYIIVTIPSLYGFLSQIYELCCKCDVSRPVELSFLLNQPSSEPPRKLRRHASAPCSTTTTYLRERESAEYCIIIIIIIIIEKKEKKKFMERTL
jgi:hypothetical protein